MGQKTLSDLGISVDIYAADGRRLNEASEYMAEPVVPQAEPSVIDHAIGIAKSEAANEPDAVSLGVSVLIGGEWHSVWSVTWSEVLKDWS